MRKLDNEVWGYESNCFVCERSNERGLRIPFAHDEERDLVIAAFSLDDAFSGAPRYVHGGVLLAILDEAMAWATIAIAGAFAVTRDTSTRFRRPVRLGEPHTVEARVTGREGRELTTEATILDATGAVCAAATATFVALDAAQVADATGAAPGPAGGAPPR